MYKKINRTAACKELAAGNSVIFVPCNCSPYSMFAARVSNDQTTTFDTIVNTFTYYNCNKETGRRLHYYIEEKEA